MAESATLPDDGDVIEFEKVPHGSLIPPPIVTPEGSKPLPQRRYRVEHKPLDREYLLIDTLSGHASRVPAHEFKRAKWEVVIPPEGPATIADEQLASASSAQPLSSVPGDESAGNAPLFPTTPPVGD
jgi:hypothetical protein